MAAIRYAARNSNVPRCIDLVQSISWASRSSTSFTRSIFSSEVQEMQTRLVQHQGEAKYQGVGGHRGRWSASGRREYTTSSAVVPKIVFLGPPGVGKGTYAKRIAKLLGVPHIAVGDLLRNEVKEGTELGKEVEAIVSQGALVPDETVLSLLKNFLQSGSADDTTTGGGEKRETQVLYDRTVKSKGGYVLDGFPRTVNQAKLLSEFEQVNLVLNLYLREDVLIEKCLGRRICTKCNGNYNVADIYRPADEVTGMPEIIMPPLSVPEGCEEHIVTRKDDTEEVILKRLQIYKEESDPLENFYRESGLLLDYEITGGIDHTLPTLSPAVLHNLK
ncbi:adenylate kinase [Chloropicon primus]|uniref:adenylate kinase n=1 Tax=Chloropicon primus TaxID=1764295 RepID=A0A5B8MZW8_9CHLO|nr:adenylate kinase [Chloropicon primus]UPR05274.1 adenylate kinase [Chloropicon primus]|eukprot:QDZ26073.1 adenylate kinase [Chloropicon primus]